ncbi:MAG: LexA family transcriptional regulator [bacterium]
MFFSSNIKFLRRRRGRTQDDVATALGMKRSTLSGYENGIAQPAIEALVHFSNYFNIAVDTLIRVDLQKLPESQMRQVERGYDVFIRGSNLRVLATTVNADNEENIELVSEKAKAGYSSGFADPEYISILPTFRLPFLSKQKKYRTFQVSGDSMLPIDHGSWVTGVFIQNWTTIRDKDAYIILTTDDGIIFKVVENRLEAEGKLILYSLNPAYEPYELPAQAIKSPAQYADNMEKEFEESKRRSTIKNEEELVELPTVIIL